MDDPTAMAGKLAMNAITELFKASLQGLQGTNKWVREKEKEFDFLGRAALKYGQKLEELYNLVHIFGMDRPVPLRNIYTEINILEKTTARHRATVDELEKFFDRDLRSFGRIVTTREGVAAINGLQRVVILGKPGAGKTTFLKYLVLQALDGNLRENRLPIFIGLKSWSDSGLSLMDYIVDQFDVCDFPDAGLFVSRVLTTGECLLLLDGFDEVGSAEIEDVASEIRRCTKKYGKNKFVLSCRIAAYNHFLEGFTEAEIADFSSTQIETFVNNWFGRNTTKARGCLKALNQHRAIRELANVPLLVTLLCLAFDETMSFPANRAELYKEALDALLKKWDASRSIKRDEIYKHLSLRRRESMFSRIAASTFEDNQYFIPQRKLEKQIAAYIQNLSEAQTDSADLDSAVVLKTIEAQHGILVERAKHIYSFSHLTFQEYFTAKYVVDNESKGALDRLITQHLLTGNSDDARWREVFLLTANMLDDADAFLQRMASRINQFSRQKLGEFLQGVNSAIKPFAHHSDTASRALVVHLSLGGRLQTVDARRTARDIARMDPDVRRHWDFEKVEGPGFAAFLDKAVSAERLRPLRKDLTEARLSDLIHYLRATSVLVDCLRGESYVSQTTRQEIYDRLLTV
jgi:predicted NACHT family NTPase